MNDPVIETHDLTKYYGKSKGIENVNLAINTGEIFGFIGPNGAGKSTTLRILLNLIFPTSGRATIMGMDVVRETRKIKNRVGYIPSDASPYSSMIVNEFLNYCQRFYGLPRCSGRIAELADMFNLDLNRKISDLSMGNRKKVSIVQSLLHKPDLLIIDEPTTGLDPLMQSRFFDLLRSENRQGMTIFFSSHILSEVQLICKRVAIIKDGTIVQTEEIESLRKKQLKKVTIEFISSEDRYNINMSGTDAILSETGNLLSFMYAGNLNDLTYSLSKLKISNLVIEEPSLDEIFMHYYKS